MNNDFGTLVGDQQFTYFSINRGKFTLPAEENAEGAKKRDWVDKDTGEKRSKWEYRYKDISALITGWEFVEGNYGENFVLELTNVDTELKAKISMSVKGKYFESFARVFKNIDLSDVVVLNAYDFENDLGKKISGISVKQNGEKVENYYYDGKKNINGFPPIDEVKKVKMGKEYWSGYFSEVRFFLKEEILGVEVPDYTGTPKNKQADTEPVTPEVATSIFNDSAEDNG